MRGEEIGENCNNLSMPLSKTELGQLKRIRTEPEVTATGPDDCAVGHRLERGSDVPGVSDGS